MDQLSLPGFELQGKIGQGGMATVWKARQLSLDRLVAIKVLSPRLASDPADVERFHAECRSAAMLKHPGIVQVYDATVHKGLYCLIMEYVAGESIGNRIRRKKKLTEDEVLFVLEHVAQALAHAWKTAGLIHCDIKPDNILIDADGSVKVTDLGLATTLGSMSALAQTEEIMGTPQFMSPEQIAGEGALDCRTDIYSLGATVYQMLTGRMLFEGVSDEAVLDLQLKGYAADVMELAPAVSSRMAWMTEKMLARRREDRHPDWSAVCGDIERLMRRGYPAPPFPAPGASVMKRSTRRQKPHTPPPASTAAVLDSSRLSLGDTVLRTAILLVILGVLAAGAYWVLFRNPPPPAVRPGTAPPAPAAATGGTTPPPPPLAADTEKMYAEMFEFARGWWEKNPGRHQEAIDRFDRVSRETKGSKYALMASDAARTVRQSREAAIEKILAELKEKADAHGTRKEYEEAALVYDRYAGPLAADMKARRTERARAWRETASRETEAVQNREREARLALTTLLDEAAAALAQGKLPEAAALLAEGGGHEAVQPLKAELEPVTELLRKANGIDQKIADSFTRQAGQEITVQLLSGPRTLIVGEVRNGSVFGDQKITAGEGVTATVKVKFGLEELAPRERAQRMGADTDPDVALVKGAAAARAKNFTEARACFARAPGEWGVRLQAALDRREAEAPPAPDPALTKPDPAGPEAPPPAPAGETLSTEAFKALLLAANPGLEDWDIECERNDRDALFRISVRSRLLQNLEPFKKLADSLEELTLAQNQAQSMAPLAALPRLRRLDLSDSGVADLAWTKDMKLEALNLNMTRIKDLTPLRGMPLRELDLAGTRIFNFDPLRGLALTRINLANTQFADMSAIREMPLRELNLSGTKVFDFLSVRRYQLTAFEAADTPFKDASLLADMPLTDLNLGNSKLSDLASLRRLPLRSLVISGTLVKDLAPLREAKLTYLRFDNCKIKDLTPLSAMPLTILSFNGSLVEDLTPLRGMGLTELEMANTSVAELEPLEGMPLTRVILSNTKVSNLRPLARCPLQELRCEGVRPESLTALRNAPIETLYIDMRPGPMMPGLLQMFPRLRNFNGNQWFRRGGP